MNERVSIDPKVCHGKPVIRGTRVPVSVIVGALASGMTNDEIQREYNVNVDDIHAALEYANDLVERDQYHPLPG